MAFAFNKPITITTSVRPLLHRTALPSSGTRPTASGVGLFRCQNAYHQVSEISSSSSSTLKSSATAIASARSFNNKTDRQWGVRHSSHSPMSPTAISTRKKVTINTLRSMHAKKTPIAMVTAHDFPSGLAADLAGMDIVLVGDSLAMVALGMEDTNQLSLDIMLHHCLAVSRGVKSAFTVGDLPMGSYEISESQAITSSIRMIQEGRVSAIKLEGGAEMAPTISRLTSIGIPVLGHTGLTPQRSAALGGFRVQGKTAAAAKKLLADARALEAAGVFGVVLEAVPEAVAEIVTQSIGVPTIGIGAGKGCSGQVLVQVDMLGNFPEGRFMPIFVKQYADIFKHAKKGMELYADEVRTGIYPGKEHTYPMSMKSEELEKFKKYAIETTPKKLEDDE